MEKVAIYIRVSTEEQTTENQLQVLEQWASDRGFEVVKIYQEIGSAFREQDRQELMKLRVEARLGNFKRLLIYSVDRLTRRGVLDMFNIIKGLRNCGVEVMSYQQPWLDPDTGFYELMLAQMAFFANLESTMISARTKTGMARAKAAGKHVGRPRKRGV